MTELERARILIVDDLPEKLLVFRTVLEDVDADVVVARSGAEALKRVLEDNFAVILLDVNMPDIDGLETANLIRQHKRTRHTPIIFITAYADEMQTALGYRLGAVDYILSPVIPEVLRTKVRVFVDL
jgi:CheY-like chemotaxis protein